MRSTTTGQFLSVPLYEKIETHFTPEPNTGCFLWFGAIATNGYGVISIGRKNRLAHRMYYELKKGPVPNGLVLDHLCRVKCCVNPDHLEPVTIHENAWVRGIRKPAPTCCPQGHEFTPENTFTTNTRNGLRRVCKRCKADYQRRYKRAKRQRATDG
jgi:hypothetical protein